MAIHWGGRGPAHKSRLAKAATAGAPTSPPEIDRIVAEGDSITFAGGYLAAFVAAYPGVDLVNLAIGGSGVGTSGDTPDPDGLTLWARLDSLVAQAPDLVTILIGANDCAGPDMAAFVNSLFAYVAEVKSRLPGVVVMLSTITPSTISGFNTNRAVVNPQIRAGAGVHFDGYIPMGDNPNIGKDADASDVAKYGDGLHPTSATHVEMGRSYLAAVGSVVDQRTGTAPTAFTFTDINNVDPDTDYTAETLVTGLGPGVSTVATCSGVGTFRRSYDGFSTGPTAVCNGDIITSKARSDTDPETAVDHILTVGGVSDTWTVTTAAADPADLVAESDEISQTVGFISSPVTFADVPFPAGLPVVALGKDSQPVTGMTINGEAARKVVETGGWSIWVGPTVLTADDYDVVITSSLHHFAVIMPAAMTGITSNVETGNSVLTEVYRAGPADAEGNNSIMVGTGGIRIMFAQSDTGAADYYDNSLVRGYGAFHSFWAKSATSGVPRFASVDYGITKILAAGFEP